MNLTKSEVVFYGETNSGVPYAYPAQDYEVNAVLEYLNSKISDGLKESIRVNKARIKCTRNKDDESFTFSVESSYEPLCQEIEKAIYE